MTAQYSVRDGVAVVTLDNPPVNGMGYDTRVAMAAGIERALADPAVVALVVNGAGKSFSGGADIKEFGTPRALQEPNLHTLIDMLEQSPKPTVVAIHGVCMGGGLELALGVELPGRRARHPGRAARSEDRHPARRRRHPAPAARIRPGAGAEHDRFR